MAKKDTYFIGTNGQGFNPNPQTPITPFTPTEKEQKNQPQTISEQIASSVNPELEFQKYLYQTGLENVFSQYQKNIANLDNARQQDIADAYFIREMSKKYLGEYASNVGIGDVSGNLIDIYANYAENISGINQNYESLKVDYEDAMTSDSQKIAQNLLASEVGLKLEEYNETLLQASTDIAKSIQTGDYGDYDNYTDYINSLDLPQKQKDDLLEWANQEKTYFETTSFVGVKGTGTSQEELARFGLTEQQNLDLNYYSNESLLSDYAYVKNGNYYGVSSEIAMLPTTALEDFNYQIGGMVAYKGETYVYMGNDEFHKMVQVEMEGAKIPREDGLLVGNDYNIGTKGILYNGVNYKQDKKIKEYDDEMLKAFGLTMSEGDLVSLNTIEKEWQFAFYNGQYYVVHYDDNGKNIKIFSMKKAD